MTPDLELRRRQLYGEIASYRRRHRELAGQLACLAGQIADTEDQIAEQAERLAQCNPVRAQEHRRRAQHARDYSAYERSQQLRWAAVAARTIGL
jgi:chromosome segregation ATPase